VETTRSNIRPSLSGCRSAEIEAIRLALRQNDNLSAWDTNASEIIIKQGLSYGMVHLVHEVARSLGICRGTRQHAWGLPTPWQVIAI
jgi:hypothetical protein